MCSFIYCFFNKTHHRCAQPDYTRLRLIMIRGTTRTGCSCLRLHGSLFSLQICLDSLVNISIILSVNLLDANFCYKHTYMYIYIHWSSNSFDNQILLTILHHLPRYTPYSACQLSVQRYVKSIATLNCKPDQCLFVYLQIITTSKVWVMLLMTFLSFFLLIKV